MNAPLIHQPVIRSAPRRSPASALFGERTGEDVEDVLEDIAEAVLLRGGDV